MPILAGQIIKALDFAGAAAVYDATDILNFNSTTYVAGTPVVGLTFMAPTSGAVLIHWYGRLTLETSTAQRVLLSTETREGAVIGSGTIVQATADDASLECGQATSQRHGASMVRDLNGLTPGATYNVRLMHKNVNSVASAASIQVRSIYVVPHQL